MSPAHRSLELEGGGEEGGPERGPGREKRRGLGKDLTFASWNVRTLLEAQCPVQTAAGSQRVPKEDRKIDLIVCELRRLQIEIADLQE